MDYARHVAGGRRYQPVCLVGAEMVTPGTQNLSGPMGKTLKTSDQHNRYNPHGLTRRRSMRTIAVLLLLASPAAAQITGNVDYLYWQANSSDFHHYIDRGPDTEHAGSGVRAGIGYRLNCWEASWNYTYYASDAFGERSYPISYWEEYLSCDDDLDYQVHDLQLLRRFCLGQCCELDVFGGFRWGAGGSDFPEPLVAGCHSTRPAQLPNQYLQNGFCP